MKRLEKQQTTTTTRRRREKKKTPPRRRYMLLCDTVAELADFACYTGPGQPASMP